MGCVVKEVFMKLILSREILYCYTVFLMFITACDHKSVLISDRAIDEKPKVTAIMSKSKYKIGEDINLLVSLGNSTANVYILNGWGVFYQIYDKNTAVFIDAGYYCPVDMPRKDVLLPGQFYTDIIKLNHCLKSIKSGIQGKYVISYEFFNVKDLCFGEDRYLINNPELLNMKIQEEIKNSPRGEKFMLEFILEN